MVKLSKKEKELLNVMEDSVDVKTAASRLNMSADSCYLMLYRIRRRYLESRMFINTIISLRKRSPLLRKTLTPKIPEKEPVQEERGEELIF